MHLTGKISVFFLSYSSLFYIATQIWWSYLMLFCHVITVLIENDCIILVLRLSFYNSDFIIIFDVILPCPYCFYRVHPYWKIIVLFLFYSCLSTTHIWWSYLILFCHVLTFFNCEQPYWKMIVLLLSYRCLFHLQLSPQILTFLIVCT